MISTDDLTSLPDLVWFRRVTRALATLDAILCPEWEYRYYSFDPVWGDGEGEEMASMRDGEGDHWFALICEAGVALVGLSHESPAAGDGGAPEAVFGDLPDVFHESVLREPAFNADEASFSIWRLADDSAWHAGSANAGEDGSEELLSILDGDPERYVAFAREYYEVEIAVDDVRAIYEHAPLTRELALRLNPEADFDGLQADVAGTGYPLAT